VIDQFSKIALQTAGCFLFGIGALLSLFEKHNKTTEGTRGGISASLSDFPTQKNDLSKRVHGRAFSHGLLDDSLWLRRPH